MDTPGHVSERDGQEEDENKWDVGEGRGEKKTPCQVKDTNAREGVKCEQREEHVLKRDCVKVYRARRHCTALHVTYGIHT